MPRIPLVGPTYQERSLPFDAQRTINFYLEYDQAGKEPSALYGTPGLKSFVVAGDGPVRGEFSSTNGRAFAVSGDKLYEITSGGIATELGTLNTSSGVVTMAENDTQLAICDGEELYILTYSSDAFVEVTDPDLPSSVGMVMYLDGYFIVVENNSGRFYLSAIGDGTDWDALDFATAESSPDQLKAVVNGNGQLWLFGDKTTEIWTNTGESTFPFRRISGGKLEVGALSAFAQVEIDNSIFWIGNDEFGKGVVYRTSGFQPQRISTPAIERAIQSASTTDGIRAFAYEQDGHFFYFITGGGLETSLVYDLTTQQWHERAYLNSAGNYEQHLAADCMFAFGKHLVGDRRNGHIYEMSLDYYDDNGDEISSRRIFTHVGDMDRRIRYNRLDIFMETGVGTQTGQGQDPKISLRLSKDGARTWSNNYTKSIGKVGKYQQKVTYRRLGISDIITFEVTITDPVKRALIGAYLE